MTLAEFLEHWGLDENPFRGEEARTDPVLLRMEQGGLAPGTAGGAAEGRPATDLGAAAAGGAGGGAVGRSAEKPEDGGGAGGGGLAALREASVLHSDFEKVLGDPRRPSSAVVFGEKGSGKTAMRLQIIARLERHNREHAGARVLLVSYDDLNPMLDRLRERVGSEDPLEVVQKTRLVDHLDAILSLAMPRIVDAFLGMASPVEGPVPLPTDPRRAVRRLDVRSRRDLLLLQAMYDRPDASGERTRALRRRLRLGMPILTAYGPVLLSAWMAGLIGAAVWAFVMPPAWLPQDLALYAVAALGAAWLLVAMKVTAWDRLARGRLARRLRKQLRVVPRGDGSFRASLRELPPVCLDPSLLPLTDSDQPRYAALSRVRRVLANLGYTGLVILVDRVDEPTLVSGDPERMKAVVWPMLHNKFLQQEGVGVKLLLPMELRHALFRESSAFFQEARLDKQSTIEQLQWSGAMLFDLCESRVAACRRAGAKAQGLLDLFEADVTRADLIEALDRLRQPRDAFKFLYKCLVEHCAAVTRGEGAMRVSRHVMLACAKGESDRAQQALRGIRPL